MLLVATTVVTLLIAIAILHLYWALGGHRGAQAAVPEHAGKPLFVPGPVACLVVAALLSAAALVVGSAATDWLRPWLPRTWSVVATVLVGVAFSARAVGDFRWVGFFKRQRATAFARLDTRVYSPLCLALGTGSLLVALAAR